MVEVYTAKFVTSLTAALSTTSRPTTISVAATTAALGASGGTFSILIYDAGTAANPVNAEAFEVTGGGATLTWTVDTESDWTPATHANGSEVLVTVLTPRSITQPLTDHITPATQPDPHTIYTRKASFTTKGDVLVGTGSGTFTRQGIGADGTSPIADSAQTTGWRWGLLSLGSVLTHMGDLIVGGVLGAAQRLGIGTVGQTLTVVANAAAIANPGAGPTCSAGSSGGSLTNGQNYDFAFSWSNGSSPDGGETLISAITQFTATSTGRVNVQAPAAPSAGLTLIVYSALHSGTLHQEGTLPNASTSSTNTVTISALAGSTVQSASNTTGGISAAWAATALPSSPTFSGEVTAADFNTTGLTGSTSASRFVGATTGGPPTTGAHNIGDWTLDRTATAGGPLGWKCTVAGTPGTWVPVSTNPMTAVGDLIVGGTVTNGYAAATRLAASTAGLVLTAGGAGVAPSWQAASGGGGGGSSGGGGGSGALVPLQAIGPITAVQSSFSFTAPPTGFRNLVIKGVVRSDVATTVESVLLQLNGDATAGDYAGGTVGAGSSANTNSPSNMAFAMTAANAPANYPTPFEMRLDNYLASNFYKTAVTNFGVRYASNYDSEQAVAYWLNTNPVTSITLVPASGNFDVGSYVCLYGEMDTTGVLLTPVSNLLYDSGVLTASQASISSGTLAQGYKSLRIEFGVRGDASGLAGATPLIQLNGDTTSANYNSQYVRGTGSTATATEAIGSAAGITMLGMPTTTATADRFGRGQLTIGEYAGAREKTGIGLYGVSFDQSSTDTQMTAIMGHWRSTAAITSVLIKPSTGNFVAGSWMRIYGEPVSAGGASVGTGTRLRISANQSITNSTATALNWDTEDSDADNQHYTSAANLTGTLAKTNGSQAVVGTTTLFTTELSVGQVFDLPGTAVETRVVTSITDNTHLTVNTPYANTASGQTATRRNSAIAFRQPGFYECDLGVLWATIATGNLTAQIRLNGTTMLAEDDRATLNAAEAVQISCLRQFQQWDYIEAIVTQTSAGAVNVTADERTHFAVSGRPTVIVAVPYVNIQDQKAQNTQGGTFTSGAWRTRDLNTVQSDSAGISSLSSNQITLQAGTYRCLIKAPAYGVNNHQARLQNITDTTTILVGTSEMIPSTDGGTTSSLIQGRFTLSSTKVLEIQHQCLTTRSNAGFGAPANFTTEVYTVAQFWKEG